MREKIKSIIVFSVLKKTIEDSSLSIQYIIFPNYFLEERKERSERNQQAFRF